MRAPPDTCGSCHFGQFHDQMFSGICQKYNSIRVADQVCEKFAKPQAAVQRPFVKKPKLKRKRSLKPKKVRA